MQTWPVSPRVNSPKNNDSEIVSSWQTFGTARKQEDRESIE
jgi:hypothetical protein